MNSVPNGPDPSRSHKRKIRDSSPGETVFSLQNNYVQRDEDLCLLPTDTGGQLVTYLEGI